MSRSPWELRLRISRGLFQYSLRTLLLVTTLVAVWLSLWMYRTPMRIDKEVHAFHWSPDGQRVAFVGWEEPVEIRDAASLQPLHTVAGRLIDFAFSPDPDVVACCENGRFAEIRNLRSGTVIQLDAQNDQPDLAFSPDGRLLATGGDGKAVRLWQVADGKLLNELSTGPVEGGLRPVFSPDGKTLAVGNRNSTTRLFDVESGKPLHQLSRPMTQELRFDPTGRKLAVSYVDGRVGLWDVATGSLEHLCDTGAEEIYTLDWSPDGRRLAAAGLKGDVLMLDGQNLTILERRPGAEWVISVKFSPDGSRLLTAGGQQVTGGKRWVEVRKPPSRWVEGILIGMLWLLGAALIVLGAVVPAARRLARSRRGVRRGSPTPPPP